MTNFQFYKRNNLKWLYIAWLPKIDILKQRDSHLDRYPEAWGYYDAARNRIIILSEHDCLAIRIHEYGHWLNARLYLFIDSLWEFPWWGLGLRSLFEKGSKLSNREDS